MTLSTAALATTFRGSTDACPLILLTITVPGLADPIRVTSDSVDTVSRGDTYLACPFRLVLPEIGDNGPPRARLQIDNVGQQLTDALRSLQPGQTPVIACEVVWAEDPDEVEYAPFTLDLLEIRMDALVVEGTLGKPDPKRNPVPYKRFTPGAYRGIF